MFAGAVSAHLSAALAAVKACVTRAVTLSATARLRTRKQKEKTQIFDFPKTAYTACFHAVTTRTCVDTTHKCSCSLPQLAAAITTQSAPTRANKSLQTNGANAYLQCALSPQALQHNMHEAPIQHVDFAPFSSLDVEQRPIQLNEQQRSVAQQLDHSIRTHGFLFLDNIGLSCSEMRHALHSAKQLFDKPLSHKLSAMKIMHTASNCGYIPQGDEILNRRRRGELKEVKHCHLSPITVHIYYSI